MAKWYDKEGFNSDVVVSSRVRLGRNLENYPFSSRIAPADSLKLVNEIVDCLGRGDCGTSFSFTRMGGAGDNQKGSLKERQLISTYMAGRSDGAVAFTEDEGISVQINGEDHIRIQSMKSGTGMEDCLKAANMIDDYVDRNFSYAFCEKYGYHTTYPTNLGTGLRAAYRLHLPALANTHKLQVLSGELGRFGVKLSPCFGEGVNAMGDVYQIVNQHTLGQSEQDIIHNLDNVVRQLIRQEREMRDAFVHNNRLSAEDEAYKSYGVLKYSRCLSLKNAMVLLSEIRMGQYSDILKFKDDEPFSAYSMMLAVQPSMVKYKKGREKEMSVEEVDAARADYVREHLPELA